jgi:predicted nucleotide-binding protein
MQKWIPVIKRLEELCDAAARFQGERLRHASWQDWSADAKALLVLALGRDNLLRTKFKAVCDEVDAVKKTVQGEDAQSDARKARLDQLVAILSSVRREAMGRRVFLAHGRDQARADVAALVLHEAGLEPIVLWKQPDGGKTIIEKFEEYADASFAVILLTADDLGEFREEAQAGRLRPRARQNAVLELGFFVGRLGRENVCVVADAEVEIPSDYHGVVNIQFDPAGEWKHQLTGRLRQAGFELRA